MNANPTTPTSIADKARALAHKINKDNRLEGTSLLLCAGIAITVTLLAQTNPKPNSKNFSFNEAEATARLLIPGSSVPTLWSRRPLAPIEIKPLDKIPNEYKHVWRKIARFRPDICHSPTKPTALPMQMHLIEPNGTNPYIVATYMGQVCYENKMIPIVAIPKAMIEDASWEKLLTAPISDFTTKCYYQLPDPPQKRWAKECFPVTRTLTSKDGKTMEAVISNVKNGNLIGKRTDNQQAVSLPFTSLSPDDQTFFRENVAPAQKKVLVIGENIWDGSLDNHDMLQPTYVLINEVGKTSNYMAYPHTAAVEFTRGKDGFPLLTAGEDLRKVINEHDAVWIGASFINMDKVVKLVQACKKPCVIRFRYNVKSYQEFIDLFDKPDRERMPESRSEKYNDYVLIEKNCVFFNDFDQDEITTHVIKRNQEALNALIKMLQR